MLNRNCPRCSHSAKLSFEPHGHDIQHGAHMYHTIKHARWWQTHPALAVVGLAALGVTAAVKTVEACHYHCDNCGHRFSI